MSEMRTSRRTFLGQSLAATVALCARKGFAQAGKRPNLVLVFSDQQHWRALGCMDPWFDTPAQDAFEKESLHFVRMYCTTPQCSPSRSSLLTGRYPSKTGVMGNSGALGGNDLAERTIGAELRDAGYRTGYFGKWHLGNNPVANAGWDAIDIKTNDANAEKSAVAFIEEVAASEQPFALFVSFLNPHDIYSFEKHTVAPSERPIPLPTSLGKEDLSKKPAPQLEFMTEDQGTAIYQKDKALWQQYRDCYRAKNRLYDDNVDTVLGALKKQGLWDDTIVILTADHGDMDTNHGLIFKGPFLYEHMVRIPLMIRVPQRYHGAAARRVDDLDVVNVDLAPTIRDACGLAAQPGDGISLWPVLTGLEGQKTRPFVIVQYYGKQQWVNPIRMIRKGDYKFIRYIAYGEELYNLATDPDELENLAADPAHANVREELATTLDKWIEENNDPFYTFHPTDRKGNILNEDTTKGAPA